MTDATRVTMLWPPALKERVRERVGARGLTAFTLEAVEAKLGTHDAHKADAKELNEVRDLVQRMADMFVRASDYEDPLEQLQELGLPSWIDTTGWPSELASVVPVELTGPVIIADAIPELTLDAPPSERQTAPRLGAEHPFEAGPGSTGMTCTAMVMRDGGGDQCGLPAADHPEAEPSALSVDDDDQADEYAATTKAQEDEDLHRPMALTKKPAGNLFAQVQEKSKALGIDLSGVDLQPASQIKKPAPRVEEPVPEPEPVVEPAVVEVEPEAASPVCPACGGPLVNGECWECF